MGRLAVQWVEWIVLHWKEIHPLEFREQLSFVVWPESVALLLEHAQYSAKMSRAEASVFKTWSRCITHGIRPACGELYLLAQGVLLENYRGKMRSFPFYLTSDGDT
jgi:hypothetical protein